MKVFLLVLLIGIFSGVVAALCGIGGGVILVPAFVWIANLSWKEAVATSLSVIIFTSLSATISNAKAGLIDWKIVIFTSLGAVIAAYFASDFMRSLANDKLQKIFAVFLILIGIKIFFQK